jgi:drug/metabolite transporter (DMT)-like permease
MKILLAFIGMISCTVLANILLKVGLTDIGNGLSGFLERLFSWRVITGLSFFGLAVLIYLIILSWLPLNVAQSFAAAQFIAVILASFFVLGESVSSIQMIGILLIAIGIAAVGLGNY